MIGTERLLPDRQRPLVERARRRELARSPEEIGQVVEAGRHLRMIGAQRLLPDRQRALVARARAREVAHPHERRGEAGRAECRGRVIGRQDLREPLEGGLQQPPGLGILPHQVVHAPATELHARIEDRGTGPLALGLHRLPIGRHALLPFLAVERGGRPGHRRDLDRPAPVVIDRADHHPVVPSGLAFDRQSAVQADAAVVVLGHGRRLGGRARGEHLEPRVEVERGGLDRDRPAGGGHQRQRQRGPPRRTLRHHETHGFAGMEDRRVARGEGGSRDGSSQQQDGQE